MGDAGLSAFAMEFMPRITRAQSMDILSSQSNLSGYKAVIEAANLYGRAFPMMMTAAGTVPAAEAPIVVNPHVKTDKAPDKSGLDPAHLAWLGSGKKEKTPWELICHKPV